MKPEKLRISRRVAWSRYVTVCTIICCIVFIGVGFIAESAHIPVVLFSCIGIVMVCAFYYSPVAVSVDRHNVIIRRMLTPKHIPVNEIASVSLFQSTMDVRVVGSGGFFGYYGWFRNREIGRYFAYIGKWKDTFLIEMKSGRKYVVSCNQPEVMVKSIMDRMSPQ